jgi:glycosyltransferase involved in cell wall biosynthesis
MTEMPRWSLAAGDRGHQALPPYVLITPARNEQAFIEHTIRSVIGQTLRPLKWVIVSDGSADGTDGIVKRYAADHAWIEFVRMPERAGRSFSGKVFSFNAGVERVRGLPYAVIGNLDADLSFGSDLFTHLLGAFAEDPGLGVAGPPFTEGAGTYDFRFTSPENVWGGCQLFRRECFDAIGGYTPLAAGGIDVVAVLMARMKGWRTRTVLGKACVHHRPLGTAKHGALAARFALGRKDYLLGRHPIWQIFRGCYQMTRQPYVVGAFMLLAGYLWCGLRRVERPLPDDVVTFQRQEQMHRLKTILIKVVARSLRDPAATVPVPEEPAVPPMPHRARRPVQ